MGVRKVPSQGLQTSLLASLCQNLIEKNPRFVMQKPRRIDFRERNADKLFCDHRYQTQKQWFDSLQRFHQRCTNMLIDLNTKTIQYDISAGVGQKWTNHRRGNAS